VRGEGSNSLDSPEYTKETEGYNQKLKMLYSQFLDNSWINKVFGNIGHLINITLRSFVGAPAALLVTCYANTILGDVCTMGFQHKNI